jgi:serralysin
MTDVDALEGEDIWGYAFTPPYRASGSGLGSNGDVWVDFARASSSFSAGSYDFMALIHEIGHAIGLKHPFEEGTTLPADYATTRYSVMAYTDYSDDTFVNVETTATGIKTVPTGVFATTPMVFDIAAIQARYGADPTTAAGATTYSWSQATPFMEAIYDAGGVDTIDLASHTRASIIDLTPGAYSSIDYYSAADQAAYWTSVYPWAASFLTEQFSKSYVYTWSNNLGIAYGTVIENVAAGSGADTISGNEAANNIAGGAGDDSIAGGAGEDYLRGGLGADRIVGGGAFDDINGNQGNDVAYGGAGADWVVGGQDNDALYGEADNDIVYGNLGSDTAVGGDGADLVRGGQGDDSLDGGAGDDWLSGDKGSDTLSGGLGADVFHSFGDAGVDRVLDFTRSQGDRIQLDAGTVYTAGQSGSDIVIDMTGGGQVILVGVTLASLTGDWIVLI